MRYHHTEGLHKRGRELVEDYLRSLRELESEEPDPGIKRAYQEEQQRVLSLMKPPEARLVSRDPKAPLDQRKPPPAR
jgi:hypothetical protein